MRTRTGIIAPLIIAASCVILFHCISPALGARKLESLEDLLLEVREALPPTDDALLAGPMLGRPTDSSVTIGIVVSAPAVVYVEYGATAGGDGGASDSVAIGCEGPLGSSAEITLTGLSRGTEYHYRIMARTSAAADFREAARGRFRTQRPRGGDSPSPSRRIPISTSS